MKPDTLQTLSQLVALIGVVLTGLGSYGAIPPLLPEDVQKLKAQGYSYAAKIRQLPMAASVYAPEIWLSLPHDNRCTAVTL